MYHLLKCLFPLHTLCIFKYAPAFFSLHNKHLWIFVIYCKCICLIYGYNICRSKELIFMFWWRTDNSQQSVISMKCNHKKKVKVFLMVNIKVVVLWDVTLCSFTYEYQLLQEYAASIFTPNIKTDGSFKVSHLIKAAYAHYVCGLVTCSFSMKPLLWSFWRHSSITQTVVKPWLNILLNWSITLPWLSQDCLQEVQRKFLSLHTVWNPLRIWSKKKWHLPLTLA